AAVTVPASVRATATTGQGVRDTRGSFSLKRVRPTARTQTSATQADRPSAAARGLAPTAARKAPTAVRTAHTQTPVTGRRPPTPVRNWAPETPTISTCAHGSSSIRRAPPNRSAGKRRCDADGPPPPRDALGGVTMSAYSTGGGGAGAAWKALM